MERFASPDDLRDDVPELGTATRSWTAVVLVSVAAVVVGLGWTFTFYLAIIGALAFLYGGFVYGLVGMTIIGIRWIAVPRENVRPIEEEVKLTEVHLFRTGPQRYTFALNIVLLINLACFLATFDYGGRGESGGFFWGSIAQVAGGALIVFNTTWAYRRRYILAEHDAMTHRLGRYRLIAINRVLSYLVWLTYTTAAGYAIFSASAGASVLDAFL